MYFMTTNYSRNSMRRCASQPILHDAAAGRNRENYSGLDTTIRIEAVTGHACAAAMLSPRRDRSQVPASEIHTCRARYTNYGQAMIDAYTSH
jgi:hypothetical protein